MANLRLSLEIIAATQKAAANVRSFVASVVAGSKEATAAGNQGEAFTAIREGAAKASAQVKKLKADVADAAAQARGRIAVTPTIASTGTTRAAIQTQVGIPAIPAQNARSGATTSVSSQFQNISPTVAQSIREIETRIKALAPAAERAQQGVTKGFREIKSGADSISVQLQRAQQALGAYFVVQSGLRTATALGTIADDYGNLQNRIRLATGAGRDNLPIARQLLQVAQETRAPLAGVVDLYARIAPGLRELGESDGKIVGTARTVGQLLAVSSTKGPAAAGALNQFAQALGAGALRGDEFNSVNEQAPAIMQAVADGLGVPGAALRKYAEEGKLTTEFVTRALASQADAIDEQFASLPDTLARSGTASRNAFGKELGELNSRFGVTATVARGLIGIADNMQSVFSAAFTAIGVGFTLFLLSQAKAAAAAQVAAAANAAERASLVLKAQALVATAAAENTAAIATLRNAEASAAAGFSSAALATAQARQAATAATLTATQSTLALATARAATGLGLGAQALKLFTGPVGAVAITVLSAIAGYWFSVGRNAGNAADEIRRAVAEQNKGRAPQGRDDIQDTLDEGGSFTARQIRDQALVVQRAKEQLTQAAAATPSADDFRKGVLDTQFYAETNKKLLAAEAQLAKLQDVATQEESLLELMQGRRTTAAADQAGLKDEFAASTGTGDKKAQKAAEKALQERLDRQRQRAELTRRGASAGLDADFAVGKIDGAAYIEARAQLVTDSIDAQHRAVQQALAKNGIGNDLRDKLATELDELGVQAAEQASGLEKQRIEIRQRGDGVIAQSTADRLRLEGREYEAAQLELRQRFDEHLRELRAAGVVNAEQMAADWKAAQLKGIESEDIARALNKAQAAFNQRRDTADAQVEVGDLSPAQGRANLRKAQQEYLAVVDAITRRIEAAPDLLPSEKLAEFRSSIASVKAELGNLMDTPSQRLLRDWSNTTDAFQQVGVTAFNGLADALTEFVTTGKLSFKSLADTVIRELIRIQVQKAIAFAVGGAGGGAGGGGLLGLISAGASIFAAGSGGTGTNYTGGTGSTAFTASSASNGAGGFNLSGFDQGGAVRGPGSGTSDSILAKLSNGEYVLKAAAVRRLGVGLLDRLNNGSSSSRVARFAEGGLVGGSGSSRSAGDRGDRGNTTINVSMPVDARAATDPAQIMRGVALAQAQLERRLAEQFRRGTGAFA